MNPDLAQKSLEYGKTLYELKRYAEAESELRKALSRDPNDWQAHVYLSLSLVSQARPKGARANTLKLDKLSESLREARQAISCKPDAGLAFFALAVAQLASRKPDEALRAAQDGLRLDPQSAWPHLITSDVYFQKRDWLRALAACESGLKAEPGSVALLNNRAYALIMLDREGEARQAVLAAVSADPSSDTAHENLGWLALYQNDPGSAASHFREALRLDATSETARKGLLRAIQSRNPLYRWILRYRLWTSRLARDEFLYVIYGIYTINTVLSVMAQAFFPLYLIFLPWFIIYRLFVYLTWIDDASFFFLLRLNRVGRLALSKDETAAGDCFGACMLACLLNLAAASIFRNWGFVIGAVLSLAMLVPASGMFKVRRTSTVKRGILLALAVLLAVTALCGEAIATQSLPWAAPVLVLFLLAWLAYPWIASAMIWMDV